MDERHRSTAARWGIVALNLLLPGLGWFRVGRWRAGLLWLAAVEAVFALLILIAHFAPTPSFGQYVAVFGVTIAVFLVLYVTAMIGCWRASLVKADRQPWWARWYGLLAIVLLASLLHEPLQIVRHRYYKPFYTPTESMMPTLAVNDRFLVDMRPDRTKLRRGDMVLVEAQGQIRIYRIAALPGDRIAMREGVPVINGIAAEHRVEAVRSYDSPGEGRVDTRQILERIPGEAGSHSIFDMGYIPEIDEMTGILLPPGRIFLLGDNRERAADSRVSAYLNGIGILGVEAVIGRPLFLYWSDDRSKIGQAFDH